ETSNFQSPIVFLLLVGLNVVEHEVLECRIRQTEAGGFSTCPIEIPLIHQHALDEPHRGGAVTAGAMDERRLVAGLRHGLKKPVDNGVIRRRVVERKIVEVDAGGLGGSGFTLDVSALFGRYAQIDDGSEAHLLDLRNSRWSNSPRAGNRRLDPRKIRNPGDGLFLHLSLSTANYNRRDSNEGH